MEWLLFNAKNRERGVFKVMETRTHQDDFTVPEP
jgi:hypothetical protein